MDTAVAPRSRRGMRGFTLLELMVVVAIIAILAAIALPSYRNYVLRSKIRLAQSDLLALSANIENARQRTLSYPADATAAKRGWTPAASSADFTFGYATASGGYTLTAEGGSTLGSASGCTLTLTDTNQRSVSSACGAVGVDAW